MEIMFLFEKIKYKKTFKKMLFYIQKNGVNEVNKVKNKKYFKIYI